MPTPTDELTALHALAKSCPGGVEGCAWWPDHVYKHEHGWWEYDGEIDTCTIDPQHALDLVTAEAERWLSKQQFGQYQRDGLGDNAEYSLRGIEFNTLHDALKYAMEHSPPA